MKTQHRPSRGRRVVAGIGQVLRLFSYVYAAGWVAVVVMAAVLQQSPPWLWVFIGLGIAFAAWWGGRALVRVGHRNS